MSQLKRLLLFFGLVLALPSMQSQDTLKLLQTPQSFHKSRFYVATGTGAVLYGSAILILNNVWYAQYDRTSFHTFNDFGEWRNMDKMGHAFTAYMYSNFAHKGLRWTGVKQRKSAIAGAAIGMGLQGTLEMLDAYSAKWGFSWSDIGFNTLGSSLFLGQELLWKEQRIKLKMSTNQKPYPTDILVGEGAISSPAQRAEDLYGGSFGQRFIKDYNAQTIWATVNIYSFLDKDSRFPKWLNIAVGYSGENIYGGYGNTWSENGVSFDLTKTYPRYSQFFISPDIDLSKLKYKRRWVKLLAGILNIIKIPGPALEFNTLGKMKFRPIYF